MDNIQSFTLVSFFSVLLVWTLNGSSGKDLNDVVVDYYEAKAETTACGVDNEE